MVEVTPESSGPIYGVINEASDDESRVAVTPDVVRRLRKTGVSCLVESSAGMASHYSDDLYRDAGATVKDRNAVLARSDVLGFVSRPAPDLLDGIRPGTWIAGMLQSLTDQPYIDLLAAHRLVGIAMERLPRRLSSAQSMDEMTSQNSVMGYKAVLVAANAYGSFLPMMTTAAGTVRPAKVLVLGAGIAGLQAIGTARRLGAVVTAYDVRDASRSEVESLGASFLDLGVDLSSGQGEGGYARELTEDEKAAQQAAVDRRAAEFDIVITTAKVPGRRPPRLLTSSGVAGLRRGAVVVDCAASDLGGNVEGSVPGTLVTDNGVTLIGAPNLASEVPDTASALLSRNLADTVTHFITGSRLERTADDLGEALVVTPVVSSDASVESDPQEGE